MKKKFISTYLFIFITLLFMLSISRQGTEKIRGAVTALFSPLWENILAFKYFIYHPSQPSPFDELSKEEQLQKLQVENQLLSTELSYLNRFIQQQSRLISQLELIALPFSEDMQLLAENNKKTREKAIQYLKWGVRAIPARVIFRSFDTWNSCLWINIGESVNEKDKEPVIAKNSPVIIGKAIVGVVDFVGENRSRVRLITDSRLTPSVRASRGGEQDFHLKECLDHLLNHMERKNQLPLSPDDQKQLTELLNELRGELISPKKTKYLAKGELKGSSSFIRQGLDLRLKGIGFNYDFSDEEGDGRDLRSGKPLNNLREAAIPILKTNDMLVTTGMDGIFPPGFQVGMVTHVDLLKEGDYFYSLEAKPVIGFLEELSLVFVLPPLSQEKY